MNPTWLIVRLAWRRWRNRLAFPLIGGGSSGRKSGSAIRFGQGLALYVAAPMMVLGLAATIWGQFGSLQKRFELEDRVWQAPTPEERQEAIERFERRTDGEIGTEAPKLPAETSTRRAWAVLIALWFLGVVLTEFSNAGLDTAAWDLEWLATFPCSIAQIARARLLTRTLVSPFGWIWLLPCALALSARCGVPWYLVLPVAVLAAQPLFVLCAVVIVFSEIALHVVLRPSAIRNVKAIASVGAGLILFGTLQMNQIDGSLPRAGGLLGFAIDWSPIGLLVRVFAADSGQSRLLFATLLVTEVALVATLGVVFLQRLVRHGISVGGARTGSRGVDAEFEVTAPSKTDSTSLVRQATERPVRSPLLHREFKLLRRDFNYLAQAFLLPILLSVYQLVVGFRTNTLGRDISTLCAWGFGVASYTYLHSALRTLQLERDSYWVLFTFPRPLSELMREKAKLYAALGLVFALVFLACGADAFASFRWSDLSPIALLLVGVPTFAFVLTAFGALTTRVLDRNAPRHAPPMVMYAAMILIAIFTGTIAAGGPWRAFGVLVLTLMLAASLWQRAVDRLPYLLDPDATIPRQLSLLHAIVALLAFVVLQGLIAALLVFAGVDDLGGVVFVAYALAGLLVGWFMVMFLSGRNLSTLPWIGPRTGNVSKPRAIGLGVQLGVACAVLGIGWSILVEKSQWIPREQLDGGLASFDPRWLSALAVLAAPPFEEFLFRGLVFGGLLRSFSFGRATLLSALIFAVCHPLLAVPPVFVLGLATAFACRRTGSLLAPIVAHFTYNALVLGAGLLAR